MRAELTAIVRRTEDGFAASCAEIPGAEVEAATEQEVLDALVEAVCVVLEVNQNETMKEVGREFTQRRISVDFDDLDTARLLQVDDAEVALPYDC
jgi:hypothetical protein